MIIPTLVAIALLALGATSFGALMGLEHIAMLLGMLLAMLLRVDEYAHHAPHADAARRDAPATRRTGAPPRRGSLRLRV
jgi:hypothetical protein